MARRTHDRTQSSDKLLRGPVPRLGLWQVAVNKTKGLFGQASPRVQLQEASYVLLLLLHDERISELRYDTAHRKY